MADTERSRRLGRAMIGHLPALRRYALGLSGNMSAADDLVQDCIERALRRMEALQEEDRMAGWLRSILFNLFIDARRQTTTRGQGVQLDVVENLPSAASRPDAVHEAGEVLHAAAFLSPQHRQVLILVGVEGLSYREAADELGVPLGTVMSRLARARDQLRLLLETGVPAAPAPLPFARQP